MNKKRTRFFSIFFILVALLTGLSVAAKLGTVSAYAVRGALGDKWADIVIGKRSFGEISPREIIPSKVFSPGGTIVDRSVSPGRLYVWDSGNNRILGVNLADCYASATCSAQLVIGQPSANDWGGCNQDSSFQDYPNRVPASSATLCAISERTHTTLEDKSFTSLFTDSEGNLWVADMYNHRVLKFISPFTTDTVADDVWGQTSFTGNGCNLTGGIGGGWGSPPPAPTAASLCFFTIQGGGGGVALDSAGNLWVADGGNNRVLRYPNSGGTISHTADLVLGQPNFTTGGDWSGGSGLDEFQNPAAVRFDADGKLYVVDNGNNRILTFTAPFTSGMAGSVWGSGLSGPLGIEMEDNTANSAIITFDSPNGRVQRRSHDGTTVQATITLGNNGGGSIGIDAQGNLLPAVVVYGQDVYRLTKQSDGSYLQTKALFSPPYGYNLTTRKRLEQGGIGSVVVTRYDKQLIVTDGRILFWNNIVDLNHLPSLTNGKQPDGYIGASSFTEIPNPPFYHAIFVTTLTQGYDYLWALNNQEIRVYKLPLVTGQTPLETIPMANTAYPLTGTWPTQYLTLGSWIGGIEQTLMNYGGGNVWSYLWVSDTNNHRIVRLRKGSGGGPWTVDIVLGQTDSTGTQCNRGLVPEPNTGTTESADLTMLCYPGSITYGLGKLFVSDHYLESSGNWRMLMWPQSITTNNPLTYVQYAVPAVKEFPRRSATNSQSHATFSPAFYGTKMVTGYNPYLGPRFPEYYNDPYQINPSNPSDPAYALPNGSFNDFTGWVTAAAFGTYGDLYFYDSNRGQVLIYKRPFQ